MFFQMKKMIDRSISSFFFLSKIIEFLILDQLKKPQSMIGIWLDINIAIITARWMIVQIYMNRNEWITSHTYKTNNSNTSSRYQMSFYSITTHANSALYSLLSISLFTSASCRQSYAIMTKDDTLVYETDVWTTAIIRKKKRYTSNTYQLVGGDRSNWKAYAYDQKHSVFFSVHFPMVMMSAATTFGTFNK